MRPLRRHLDAIAHYAALLLVLLSLTPALMGTRSLHLPGAHGRIALCTAFGISYVNADEAGKIPPYKPQQPHCPLCVLGGFGAAILPTAPHLAMARPESAAVLPPADDRISTHSMYRLAQSRAPPVSFS